MPFKPQRAVLNSVLSFHYNGIPATEIAQTTGADHSDVRAMIEALYPEYAGMHWSTLILPLDKAQKVKAALEQVGTVCVGSLPSQVKLVPVGLVPPNVDWQEEMTAIELLLDILREWLAFAAEHGMNHHEVINNPILWGKDKRAEASGRRITPITEQKRKRLEEGWAARLDGSGESLECMP